MNVFMSFHRALCVSVPVGAAAILSACASGPPQGTSGGRVDPYRTTYSDEASSQASIPALLEFSDLTAESLARDISNIPEVRDSPTRLVLELGDLRNLTRTSTTDFELIQRRLRGKLLQSNLVTNHFRIVESGRRMDEELARVQGAGGDLLQEGATAGGTARYEADKTYVLQGDFLEATRGDRRQYYFEFKLVNLASRDIVYNSTFDLGQVRR